MENVLKYCGVILAILGVLVLAIYHFAVKTNAMLVIGLVLILAGLVAHVVVNKRIQ